MQLRGKVGGRSGLPGLIYRELPTSNSVQVSLSGCPGSDEDEDGQILTLVTNKFKFRSSTYRLSKGKVEMEEGDLSDKVVVHRPAAPVEKTRMPRPVVSGVNVPKISEKTVIDK